jgi:hypothetical protein
MYDNIGANNRSQQFFNILAKLSPNFCSVDAKLNVGIGVDMYPKTEHGSPVYLCDQKTCEFVPINHLAPLEPIPGRGVFCDYYFESIANYAINNDLRMLYDQVHILEKLRDHCSRNRKSRVFGIPIDIRQYVSSTNATMDGDAHANILVCVREHDGDITAYRYDSNGEVFYQCIDIYLESLVNSIDGFRYGGSLGTTLCPHLKPQRITKDEFCVAHSALLMMRIALNAHRTIQEVEEHFYRRKATHVLRADVIRLIRFLSNIYTAPDTNQFITETMVEVAFDVI